jgi:predicted nucleotidyltransferase component of viral defense system
VTVSRETPPSLRSLSTRIENLARERGRPVRRVQRAIANTVVGQMLPAGVVKGGTAIKLRVGEQASRFTPDLDASRDRLLSLEDYLDRLDDGLADGWGGFTGTLARLPTPQPDGVPEEYVMQPFDIRLSYLGRHWLTVRFELSHDEVGSTEEVEIRLAQDILDLFSAIGLPEPQPLPVLAVEHQIAQKLHACASVNPKTGANQRAHDLVDLQIMEQEEMIDMAAVNAVATRLFNARRGTPWPPTIRAYEGWDTIYVSAAEGLDVLEDVHAAVRWANDFIARATRA